MITQPSNPPWRPGPQRAPYKRRQRVVHTFTVIRTLELAPGLPYLPNELLFHIFWFL